MRSSSMSPRDTGIHGSNQALSQIMYRLFLQSLGYAKDLDLAELEITLEQKGDLARFEDEYERLFDKKWANEKDMVVFALSEASQVLHTMHPKTYPAADSWVRASRTGRTLPQRSWPSVRPS